MSSTGSSPPPAATGSLRFFKPVATAPTGPKCYLIFSVAGEGMLSTKWRNDAEVPEGAVAVFSLPAKAPAAFKIAELPRELIRGFRAGGKVQFYTGFCQFASLAKREGGSLELLTDSLQVFVRDDTSGTLLKVTNGVLVNCANASCAVALGEHNDTFKGGDQYLKEQAVRLAISEAGFGVLF